MWRKPKILKDEDGNIINRSIVGNEVTFKQGKSKRETQKLESKVPSQTDTSMGIRKPRQLKVSSRKQQHCVKYGQNQNIDFSKQQKGAGQRISVKVIQTNPLKQKLAAYFTQIVQDQQVLIGSQKLKHVKEAAERRIRRSMREENH